MMPNPIFQIYTYTNLEKLKKVVNRWAVISSVLPIKELFMSKFVLILLL